jgi:hypothetical protein
MSAWPSKDRCSKIVFIVRGLGPALISRSLSAFRLLAEPDRETIPA